MGGGGRLSLQSPSLSLVRHCSVAVPRVFVGVGVRNAVCVRVWEAAAWGEGGGVGAVLCGHYSGPWWFTGWRGGSFRNSFVTPGQATAGVLRGGGGGGMAAWATPPDPHPHPPPHI